MNLMPNKELVESWAMTSEELPTYINEVHTLQDEFKNQITVRLASEVDFHHHVFQNYQEMIQPFRNEFQYFIGSIHVIQIPDGKYVPIDAPNNPDLMHSVGPKIFYEIYYQELLQMVKTGYFDIVGHFDLPKKYGVHQPEGLWEIILKILDQIEEKQMVVEINTSGFRKPIGIQFPSEDIIKECLQRDIGLVLGSDSHDPKEVAYKFNEIATQVTKWAHEMNKSWNPAKFQEQINDNRKNPFY